jgi:serine/threonine protein kinase
LKYIGSGSYSDVYKAKNKLTQEYVVIKEIKKIKINYSEKEILKETEIMKKLESESSILLIETLETKDSYYIITEYCYITLDEYIKKRKEPLSIIEIKEFLLELNKILKKMNDNKIIHRNL